MSETLFVIAISAAGLGIFVIMGSIFGLIARKHSPERNQVIVGGALAASWLYLFVQVPLHIAMLFGHVDDDGAVIAILVGALLMVIFWAIGIPKRLPIIGRPIANFIIAFEKWHLARAQKRIAKLESELD